MGQEVTGPLNVTCLIEGKAVGLMDGRCELPAASGSAIKGKTAVLDQPMCGDMGGDGDEDTILLLATDPGERF